MSNLRESDWSLVRGVQALAQRSRADWKRIPKRARHTWLITLSVGWVAAGLLMWGLTWAGQTLEAAGMLAFEAALLEQIVEAVPLGFSYAMWVETPGNAVFLVPVVIFAAVVAARRGFPIRALSLLASFFMMAVVVVLGWSLWDRPRPDFIQEGLGSPGISAFPSGHMAQLISALGFMTFLWVRASRSRIEQALAVTLLLVSATLVGMSRLVLGSHWPSDVLAGTLIGFAWLAVMIVAFRRGEAAGRRAG